MKKKGQRKLDSIQWVIDALDNPPIEKRVRENHKTDEIRADENLSWCPCCRKNGICLKESCGSLQMLNFGKK